MGGSSKQKKQVVGHRYFITQHFVLCHGTVNGLREIWFADKKAWSGNLNAAAANANSIAVGAVDNSNLFGGEDSEGGVSGSFHFGLGKYDQTQGGVEADGTYYSGYKFPHPPMAVNYRGLSTLHLLDFYVGTNAYLKDISFTVERFWADWNAGVAKIGNDANPAHIIYECLTNSDWGLGYPASTIDNDSFTTAANILFNESFGLSLIWDNDQDIEDFVGDVTDCISASFYLHRRTGLWTIKLIRAGEPSKMTVDPSNSTLESYSRRALGDTYNEISVTWVNPENEEDQTLTVQDLANIQAQGRSVQLAKNYIGVRTAALAAKIAQRDIQTSAATLCTVELTTNRQGWDVMPGDVITWNWPPYGIAALAMRVTETKQAAPGDDRIAMTLVEDVFGQANATFTDVQEPGWVDDRGEPVLFDPAIVWELPFWYVFQGAGLQENAVTYSTALVSSDHTNAKAQYLYALEVGVSGSPEWDLMVSGAVTPAAQLDEAVTPFVDGNLQVKNPMFLANLESAAFMILTDGIYEEIVQLYAASADLTTLSVRRGLMDTHPRPWPVGTQIFAMGTESFVIDPTPRSRGEEVDYRPAMQTSLGQMPIGDIPTMALELRGRYGLPYSVANVSIEGSWWPSAVSVGTTLNVNWSTRNRLLQDSPVQVLWGEGNIVPEAGTTYGYELYDKDDHLISSASGLTGTHADVDLTPIVNTPKADYTLHIFSERAGLRNYMDYSHTLNIESILHLGGYGKLYGKSYGRV